MVKKKQRSLAQINLAIDHWVRVVNAALDVPWTARERVDGRKVLIDTSDDAVLSGLRVIYFEAGWEVYAIQNGGANSRKIERYLEFWRRAA